MTKLLATDGEGERLDRFELIAELASGGMATVYLARLSGVAGFQRLVAIKRLHPHLARETEFVEMFLDEARLAARIHHPNVVPIQEVGESDLGYYLVMDYVEGDTLARILARAAQSKQQIPHGVTIRILLDVLAGLHAAHEMKDDFGAPLSIVHRDISPQNILVGVDGITRVVDFGVARAASRLSTTRSGQLKGKLAYMAPEQARGANVDRRADLFACGIVLWEALAVKRLFKGDGEAETLNRVLYDPIAPPSSVREVPSALEAVCMKALERDPDKRFASAQELADALEDAARSLSCVGSVRDVAACLEQVVGTDLSQQRDAVRAWLARSEPSHGGPRSKPAVLDGITRIEGSREGSGSRRGSLPPGGGAAGAVDRSAVTAPTGPAPSLREPEKVSSVSSAILQVETDLAALAPARRRPRLGVVFATAAVAFAAAGGLWWVSPRSGAPPAPSEPPSAANEPTPDEPAPDEPPAAKAATASEPGDDAAAKVEPPEPAPRPAAGRHHAKPVATTRPSAQPAPTGAKLPDDLSSNPYR
jgi:eukaryotic-like serine/threonine-protein kinase